MSRAVIPFPVEPPHAPEEVRAGKRRWKFKKKIRVERLILSVCLTYLVGFMGWGEITDLRLRAEAAQLQSAVRQEQLQNKALQARVAALKEKSGERAAVQEQLGLVPSGQVPVVIQKGP